MASTVKGFTVRDVTAPHGWNPFGQVNANFSKVLPATAAGNLFVVTGSIMASLVGVVAVIGAGAAVKPTIGYTGKPAGLAAAPAVALTTLAAGSVIKLPPILGGAMPAPLVATSAAPAESFFEISNTTITITTDATNTMAVTWILTWAPLFLGAQSGPTVTNS